MFYNPETKYSILIIRIAIEYQTYNILHNYNYYNTILH